MRPIDANELMQKYCGACSYAYDEKFCPNCKYYEFRARIKAAPTIESEPVRHGRWIPHGYDMWLCSNCKENIIFSMHESDRTEKQRYCCRCGARMDGGVNG